MPKASGWLLFLSASAEGRVMDVSDLVASATWLLAFVFALSGVVKLYRPVPAAVAMVNFGITNDVRKRLAMLVGVVELAVAVGLAVHWRIAGYAAAGLLALFAFLISRALIRGGSFDCGCFGVEDTPISRLTLLRTLALLGVAAFILVRWEAGSAPPLAAVVAACAAFGYGLLLSRLSPLVRWNAIVFTRRVERGA
jgi:hypothetical protein